MISRGTLQLSETTPQISIIIAVHNDSKNVLTAIRSVQAQTHRSIEIIVVDDCSTDNTFELVTAHALEDSRIRVFQMPRNSGGAGGPRNLGMEMALAPHIMFLDSDDRLDRHACKNLLREVETKGAGLVMGQTKRFTVKTKRWAGWHARLYKENQFYESIEDFAELCIDTNSVAKLYSLEFLRENKIKFPEGIHYEDLVFTAMVFKAVRNISVIPEVVYVWKIYPIDERKSITNQRDSIQNLHYRIEALNMISNLLADGSSPLLASRLQLKVLRHDARLYLNDVVKRDDEMAAEILENLRPLVLDVPEECFELLNLGERLLYAAALSGDIDAVRQASAIVRGKTTLRGETQVTNDYLLWLPKVFAGYDDDDHAKKLATIPASSLVGIPWFNFRFFSQITKLVRANHKSVEISGQTQDRLGALKNIDDLTFRIRIFTRGSRTQNFYIPVENITLGDGIWTWKTNFAVPAGLRAIDVQKLGMRLEISSPLAKTENHVELGQGIRTRNIRVQATSASGRLVRDQFQAYRTVDDTIGFKLVAPGKYRRPVRKVARPMLKLRDNLLTVWSTQAPIGKTEWKFVYSVFRRLPLLRGTALFESHMGKSFSDSPRLISNELSRVHPDIAQTWSFERNSAHHGNARKSVTRGSLSYLYHLARSEYLVDNQTLPGYFRKRPGQTYLQTWHGVPLKRMGFDEPDFAMASSAKKRELTNRVSNWDFLTNPSSYFEKTFVPAYRTNAELLPMGSPRNDALVNISPEASSKFRNQLGLSRTRKTVLYAPTFRAASRRGNAAIQLEMDLDAWLESLGDDTQLLVRAHYLNRLRIPQQYADRIVDVSGIDDTSLLLSVSDILITDYSSVMFDFAVLDKPIIIYAYDLEEYTDSERGTYFDLASTRPGAIVSSQDELHEVVHERLNLDIDAEMRRNFYVEFMGSEDGTAASRSVATVWGK